MACVSLSLSCCSRARPRRGGATCPYSGHVGRITSRIECALYSTRVRRLCFQSGWLWPWLASSAWLAAMQVRCRVQCGHQRAHTAHMHMHMHTHTAHHSRAALLDTGSRATGLSLCSRDTGGGTAKPALEPPSSARSLPRQRDEGCSAAAALPCPFLSRCHARRARGGSFPPPQSVLCRSDAGAALPALRSPGIAACQAPTPR